MGELFSENHEKSQHHITIQNRKSIEITGVDNVDSFDEDAVILLIGNAVLTIEGEDLHIVKLNVDKGEVLIEGTLMSLLYSQGEQRRDGGVLSKIFKGR